MDIAYCFSDALSPLPPRKRQLCLTFKVVPQGGYPCDTRSQSKRNSSLPKGLVIDYYAIFLDFVAVTRKLGFLEVEGYDIFGKNELFAPRIKWEALKTIVEGIKNTASEYERAYNDIKETIESKSNFQQVDDDNYI